MQHGLWVCKEPETISQRVMNCPTHVDVVLTAERYLWNIMTCIFMHHNRWKTNSKTFCLEQLLLHKCMQHLCYWYWENGSLLWSSPWSCRSNCGHQDCCSLTNAISIDHSILTHCQTVGCISVPSPSQLHFGDGQNTLLYRLLSHPSELKILYINIR